MAGDRCEVQAAAGDERRARTTAGSAFAEKVREKRALQVKLQAFIAEDMQEWVRTFPEEFWHELARLEGIRYSPKHRPIRWGKYVMRFV